MPADFKDAAGDCDEGRELRARYPAYAGRGRRSPVRRSPVKPESRRQSRPEINFACINRDALAVLPVLLASWLPNGRREGWEYVALNPTRLDRHLGSFRINVRTGRWADFATGDRGGDVVSLAAYLSHLKQSEAAEKLAHMLGIGTHHAR
jgi:hypothetical protein